MKELAWNLATSFTKEHGAKLVGGVLSLATLVILNLTGVNVVGWITSLLKQ